MTPEQAAERFYILDADGLVTRKRGPALPENVRPYARHEEDLEGLRLEHVVRHVRLFLASWLHAQCAGPGLKSAGRFCDAALACGLRWFSCGICCEQVNRR